MNSDDLITEITALAERWRYEHPGTAHFSHEQQMLDGLEILQILHRHGIPWPTKLAMTEIPAPGRATSNESTEWCGPAVDWEAVDLLKRDPDAFFRRPRQPFPARRRTTPET